MCLGIAILGGLFTGYVTSREWFEPVPVEYLFHDKHHFADCVIEHEELHKLKTEMNVGGFFGSKSESKIVSSSQANVPEEQQAFTKVKPSIN